VTFERSGDSAEPDACGRGGWKAAAEPSRQEKRVSTVSSVSGSGTATSKTSQALSSDEFMRLLITQLTNQDPLEPMSNSELLQQISGIQQLQASQSMTDSMDQMSSQFGSYLMQQQLTSASQLIGQVISGTDSDGNPAIGRVSSVLVEDNAVYLQIDTGQKIAFTDVSRMTSDSSQSILGTVATGMVNGGNVTGIVQSMKVEGETVTLVLSTSNSSGEAKTVELPLSSASILNKDTVGYLTQKYVEGFDGDAKKTGYVTGYQMEDDGTINLILDDDAVLPLTGLYRIQTSKTSST